MPRVELCFEVDLSEEEVTDLNRTPEDQKYACLWEIAEKVEPGTQVIVTVSD